MADDTLPWGHPKEYACWCGLCHQCQGYPADHK